MMATSRAARARDVLGEVAGASIRRPWLVLLFWLLVSVVSGFGAARLEIDTDTSSFLDRGDPAWGQYQRSIALFGGDEAIVVALEGSAPFDLALLERVRALSIQLGESSSVERVDSIYTVPVIWTDSEGALLINPALDDAPIATNLGAIRSRLHRDRVVTGNLISSDGAVFAINVILRSEAEFSRAGAVEEVEALLESEEGVWISGVPVFRTKVNSKTRTELLLFVPATLILVGLVVLVAFRRLTAVFVSLGASSLGVWVTLGAMGALGVPLSLSTMVLPPILLGLGCAYGMHVLAAVRFATDRSAVEHAIRGVARPIGFSGLTTAIGFLAIATIRIEAIRQLGTLGALGVLSVLLATITVAPAIVAAAPFGQTMGSGGWLLGNGRRHLTTFVRTRYRWIMAAWGVVALFTCVGLAHLEVETDIVLWFPEGSDVRDSYNAIRDRLSGITPMNIVVSSTDGTPVTEPGRLHAIHGLANHVMALPEVGKVSSVADLLYEIHGAFEPTDRELPSDFGLIEQYLLLLESHERTADVIAPDHLSANILLRVNENGSRRLLELAEGIDRFWTENGIPELSLVTTGIMYEFGRAEEEIAHGQIRGLGLALLVIGVILLAIFQNLRITVAAMIANAIPLAVTYGLMGLAGIPLDAATVCLGSLALGIAVDDTIHLVSRYQDGLETGRIGFEAIDFSFRIVLPALVYTTIAVSLGFAVLGASSFTLIQNLGVVTAFLVVLCLVADLTLLPALLVGSRSSRDRIERSGVLE